MHAVGMIKQRENGFATQESPSGSHWRGACSKLPVIILSGAAVVTGVALYALSRSDDRDDQVSTQTGTGMAPLIGILLAGQALLVDAAARFKMAATSFGSHAVASDVFEDAVEYPQENERSPRKRLSGISDRVLMFPKGGEYPLDGAAIDASLTAAGYDSAALNDGHVAYVFQQANYVNVVIKNETGGSGVNKYPVCGYTNGRACASPSIANSNGNFAVTLHDSYYGENYVFVYGPSGQRISPAESISNGLTNPIALGVANGNLIASAVGASNVDSRVFDSTYGTISTPSIPIVNDGNGARTMAIGSFADSSMLAVYELSSSLATTNLAGRYWDSIGVGIGYGFNLGQCYSPKAVGMANDLVFVTCINPSLGLQGFGLNKAQQKAIPQFTISSNTNGHDSHDLAVSPDGKMVISHYINGTNSYFKTYDQDGVQQGSAIQSNENPGVSLPLAAILPNGNPVFSFIRGGMPIGRTFELNVPPVLVDPLNPPNATVNTPFVYEVPPGTWVDPNGHRMTFSAQQADGESLEATWLSFIPGNATFSGTPPQGSQGSLRLQMIADDGFLNGIVSKLFQVNVVNRPPVFGTLPSDDLTISVPYTTQLYATDPDGDPLTFSSNDLPSRATLAAQGAFSWTAISGQQGSHSISVRVADGYGGSDDKAMTLKVLNRAPVAPSISHRDFVSGVPMTFTLPPFVDPDGDLPTYTAGGANGALLPEWVSFKGDLLSGTPEAQDEGPFQVIFTGDDGYGGVTQTVGNFRIVPPPQPSNAPLITLIGGIIAIAASVLGCVYKSFQKPIDTWVDKNIKPCYVSTNRKVRTCMGRLCGRKDGSSMERRMEAMNDSKHIPLLAEHDDHV